jgi:hypothetical protein
MHDTVHHAKHLVDISANALGIRAVQSLKYIVVLLAVYTYNIHRLPLSK